MTIHIIHGDTPGALAELADESIDSCVTDPPYGLGFMGKEWDTFKPGSHRESKHFKVGRGDQRITSSNPNVNGRSHSPAMSPSQIEYDRSLSGQRGFQAWVETWAREVLRVLKPGGHLLCSGAPRSYHRMACGIEDAGFEVRDAVLWLFGQGFPKSHNLKGEHEGWGTALKPAWEPILLARKPFKGTVAENVAVHGVGALNVDACRIGFQDDADREAAFPVGRLTSHGTGSLAGPGAAQEAARTEFSAERNTKGRWPANVIHDGSDVAVAEFPETASVQPCGIKAGNNNNVYGQFAGGIPVTGIGDSGSAARFFYCAKASRADRNDGMSGFEKKPLLWSSGTQAPGTFQSPNTDRAARNNHPTVKPTDLMRYLCTLVTPPGGTVLDPFMGSGSTGRGALLGGFHFIGVEREAEYVAIADARIRAISPLFTEVTLA